VCIELSYGDRNGQTKSAIIKLTWSCRNLKKTSSASNPPQWSVPLNRSRHSLYIPIACSSFCTIKTLLTSFQLPLGLLTAAQGHPMLVELKNGETLNGHLVTCDTWMNLTLKEVVQTSPVREIPLLPIAAVFMFWLM